MTIRTLCARLGFGLAVAGAMTGNASALVFDSGTTENFSDTVPEGIQVYDSPAAVPTTLNVLAGASVGSTTLVHDFSVLNAFPGATFGDTVRGFDQSDVNLHGGTFRTLDLANGAHGTILGGTFTCGGSARCVGLFDSSTATIAGGDFATAPVFAFDSSRLAVTGGSLGGGVVADHGEAAIHGGDVGSVQATNGVVTLFGSSFVVHEDGVADPILTTYGVIPEFTHGTISGTLGDGTVLTDMPYQVGNNGNIVIAAAVPEPSTLAFLAAGAGLVAGVARRRRH